MYYKLISRLLKEDFIREIEFLMVNDNWKPLGGAFIYQDRYFQTMIKEEKGGCNGCK